MPQKLAGVLVGAEILLCANQNFPEITFELVGIFAVGVLRIFNEIEIVQLVPVESNVIDAFDFDLKGHFLFLPTKGRLKFFFPCSHFCHELKHVVVHGGPCGV